MRGGERGLVSAGHDATADETAGGVEEGDHALRVGSRAGGVDGEVEETAGASQKGRKPRATLDEEGRDATRI